MLEIAIIKVKCNKLLGNKFDLFTKSVKPAERRAVMQVLCMLMR